MSNLKQAVSMAINSVNFGSTSGHTVNESHLKIKEQGGIAEVKICLNFEQHFADIATATKALTFWGKAIRKNCAEEFVMQGFVQNIFHPIEVPFM